MRACRQGGQVRRWFLLRVGGDGGQGSPVCEYGLCLELWLLIFYTIVILWCARKPWSSSSCSLITQHHHTNNNPSFFFKGTCSTPSSCPCDPSSLEKPTQFSTFQWSGSPKQWHGLTSEANSLVEQILQRPLRTLFVATSRLSGKSWVWLPAAPRVSDGWCLGGYFSLWLTHICTSSGPLQSLDLALSPIMFSVAYHPSIILIKTLLTILLFYCRRQRRARLCLPLGGPEREAQLVRYC